jgi:hypothetical protein
MHENARKLNPIILGSSSEALILTAMSIFLPKILLLQVFTEIFHLKCAYFFITRMLLSKFYSLYAIVCFQCSFFVDIA